MATIDAYELASGQRRYRVRYRVDGAQTARRGFTTKRDAKQFAATVEVSKATGTYVAPSAGRVLVGDWVRRWHEVRADLSPSTSERYAGIIRTHIAPRWDGVAIADVRHSDVQSWTQQLGTTLSAASVRKTSRVLSLALDLAVADRLIAVNPASNIKIARPALARRRYLTHEQVAALADAAGDRRAVVLTLAYCGLRWGELAALRVRDVDLMRRRITVERAVAEVNGVLVWGAPKTHQRRQVPVPRFVADELMTALAGKGADELAFTGERRGNPLRVRVARRSWFDQAVRTSGAPEGFHFHELRHTAASLAIGAGANVKAVQRMLGHASASMTLDTYSDLFDADLDAVGDAMDLAARRG